MEEDVIAALGELLLQSTYATSLRYPQQQAETSLLACVRRTCSNRDCVEDELVDSLFPFPSGFGPI
jgi:hypothetical protein